MQEEDKSHPLQRFRVGLSLVFLVPIAIASTLALLIMGNTLGRIIGAVFALVLLFRAARWVAAQ